MKCVALLAIVALGCASPARAPVEARATIDTPDAPYRAHAPAIPPGATFVPPAIESATLSNGVRVLVVSRRDLPVVSVEIVMNAGFSDFDDVAPEAFLLMAPMLEQGTTSRGGSIADGYRAIGAEHRTWVDYDSSGASVKTLSTSIDAAIDLLGAVVQHPEFADDAVDTARSRWLAWTKQERASLERRASVSLAASVFGRDHPYGRTTLARVDDLARVMRDDVQRAYTHAFAPSRATIVAAGDVTLASLVPKLEASFGSWRSDAVAPTRVPTAVLVDPNAPRIVLCEAPKATQPRVMLAEPGIAFRAPDRDAVIVMNEILGGAYSSRIFRNLRETHSYTYGAFSTFAPHHGIGPFSAGGAFDAAHVGEAIRELLHEVTTMRDTDVSPEELAAAKRHLTLAMPARFEAASDVTRALATLVVHDLPLDEWTTFASRIDAVRIADVRAAAQAHLHPDRMKIIVTGDRRALEPILARLGLGPVELRDIDGVVVSE